MGRGNENGSYVRPGGENICGQSAEGPHLHRGGDGVAGGGDRGHHRGEAQGEVSETCEWGPVILIVVGQALRVTCQGGVDGFLFSLRVDLAIYNVPTGLTDCDFDTDSHWVRGSAPLITINTP